MTFERLASDVHTIAILFAVYFAMAYILACSKAVSESYRLNHAQAVDFQAAGHRAFTLLVWSIVAWWVTR